MKCDLLKKKKKVKKNLNVKEYEECFKKKEMVVFEEIILEWKLEKTERLFKVYRNSFPG